jgi:hypothetical protein
MPVTIGSPGAAMRFVFALLCAVLFASPLEAAQPPPRAKSAAKQLEKFETAEAILKWISGYRMDPKPQDLPRAVQRMAQTGAFKDLDTAGVYIGFIAGVLGANAADADALVSKIFPLPPEDQVALVRAIAYSGHPDWQGLLRRNAERMPARKLMIDRYLEGKLPTLAKLPLDAGPAPLDILWGQFFATGEYAPLLRIISVLEWSQDKNNMERLTIGSMAKWTLANNAQRDKDILDALKRAKTHETKVTAKILDEVIEAAELYETQKIRKEALGHIDTLKTKGSEAARNYAWWGNAGQTALALGCVVASALGQAAIGVPCVIGGAVSSAALKAFAPQQ